MKKFIFAFLALFLVTGVMAQDISNKEQIKLRADRMTNYLESKLELNEAQKKEIYDIQYNIQEQFAGLQVLRVESFELYMEKQLTLANGADEKILAVLNDGQKLIYKEIVERQRKSQGNK